MQRLTAALVNARCLTTLVVLAALAAPHLQASADVPALSGRSLGGFLIPVEPREGEISLRSLSAWRWKVDDTQRLLLSGDVIIDIAGWVFEAQTAVVWIDRVATAEGDVTQVAVYLPKVRPGTQSTSGSTRGRNLLVVGTVKGRTLLDTALIRDGQPPAGTLAVQRGEKRLAEWVARTRSNPPPLDHHPTLADEGEPDVAPGELPVEGTLSTTARSPWLRRPGATIAFSADEVELGGGEDDATVIADGAVSIEYRPVSSGDAWGRVRLSAERAVVFLEPGTLRDVAGRDFKAEDVRGVYLEGGVIAVAERDDYEVRAPRMYYDFETDRAIMVDAVLRTYDRRRRAPVIARASELRQLAENQWAGETMVLSASSFATPTLALAAQRATLKRTPATVDETGMPVAASVEVESWNNTIDAGGMPVFWWPHFKGGPQDIPLRGTKSGWGRYKGAIVETTWDVRALLGLEPVAGDDLEMELDGWSKRGVGGGINWSRTKGDTRLRLKLYGLTDSGTQRTASGVEQDVPTHQRYEGLWESTTQLSPQWMLQTQVSKFSDSTFVSAWRMQDFLNRREYETSAFLRWQEDEHQFSLLAKYDLNGFMSNSWLLASKGFSLDEMPRAAYRFFGLDLFDTITWSGDVVFSRFKANITNGTAAENGARNQAFIDPTTGRPINNNQQIAQTLHDAYIQDKWAMRLISNHHIAAPMQFGAFSVTPFTAFQGQSFVNTEAQLADNAENQRLIGGAGVTVATTLNRVWNDVEHRVLDLHRMRAIVEPSFTAWYAGSNFNPADDGVNPQYDPWIDDTSRGGAIRVGLRSTLQTMRGGPGQWFDVDWLKMDFGAVLTRGASQRRYPTPQWFAANPLFSQLGNFADGRLRWQLGEGVAMISEGVWDFDEGRFTRNSAGVELRHTPRFDTMIEYRYIEVPEAFLAANPTALDAARGQLLALRSQYEVGDLYRVSVQPMWNFSENDFQAFGASVTRKLPDFDLNIYVRYSQISGETSAGVSIGQTRF
ncbi:MAG: hypothetical protein MK101_11055 [Phycisphaerales bacterium]|nr:hypothetical protein [Phycisphaerales bacterium]